MMLLDHLLMIFHASWSFLTLLVTSGDFLVVHGLLFCHNFLVLATALNCWTRTVYMVALFLASKSLIQVYNVYKQFY